MRGTLILSAVVSSLVVQVLIIATALAHLANLHKLIEDILLPFILAYTFWTAFALTTAWFI